MRTGALTSTSATRGNRSAIDDGGSRCGRLGEIAVRVLFDLLSDRVAAMGQVTLPPTLVVRASTAPPGR
jgi:hypothetical protein